MNFLSSSIPVSSFADTVTLFFPAMFCTGNVTVDGMSNSCVPILIFPVAPLGKVTVTSAVCPITVSATSALNSNLSIGLTVNSLAISSDSYWSFP